MRNLIDVPRPTRVQTIVQSFTLYGTIPESTYCSLYKETSTLKDD